MTIHLLSSPPFGEQFWTLVCDRLTEHGYEVQIQSPIENHATLEGACVQLSNVISPNDHVVAHGLIVPLLLKFANKFPIKRAVVSNGPLTHLDPLSKTFSNLPRLLQQLYLNPTISFRFLRSSIGLRRAVVNPYVMDKEVVAEVCSPLHESSFRRNFTAYLEQLHSFVPPDSLKTELTAIWGDHDLLYPTTIATDLQNRYPNTKRIDIEGGKLLHPIERPWAIADLIHQECQSS